eukprot:scaffold230502_cov29-Tisochrysis_lutea.AAC.1
MGIAALPSLCSYPCSRTSPLVCSRSDYLTTPYHDDRASNCSRACTPRDIGSAQSTKYGQVMCPLDACSVAEL